MTPKSNKLVKSNTKIVQDDRQMSDSSMSDVDDDLLVKLKNSPSLNKFKSSKSSANRNADHRNLRQMIDEDNDDKDIQMINMI